VSRSKYHHDDQITKAAKDESVPNRLLWAAAEVFNQKGYAAASVNEIVAAAGVTKPVLYYYFQNKEGIFREIFLNANRKFESIIQKYRLSQESAWKNLINLCTEVLTLFLANMPFGRLMHGIYYGPSQGSPHVDFERLHRLFHDEITVLVEQAISQGEIWAGNTEDIVRAILGMVNVCMELALCHPEEQMGGEDLNRLLAVLFHGLAPATRAQP
jgi:AcrR family transcriptional regulator